MNRLSMHTLSIANRNYSLLSRLFPNVITETIDEEGNVVRAIDAEVLAQEINTKVVSGKEERYQFTWPDKKKSVLMANAPIAATLRPYRRESVDFDTTENLYIEGDNLDVLKLLRETYLNKVKMVYIDPPYNTGNDFIYEDDFKEDSENFLIRDSQFDEQGNRLTSNFDSNGRFHTDWLNMIYPRLKVARDLLTEDGVIFISIDDYEHRNIRKICDEIFGEENFINNRPFVWHITDGTNKGFIARAHEYILGYAKDINKLKPFIRPKNMEDESIKHLTNAPGPKNKTSQIIFPKGLRYEGEDSVIEGIVGGDKEPIKVIGKMIFKNGFLFEDAILESSWRNKKQIETFFSGKPSFDEKGQEIIEVFMKKNGKPMYRKKLSFFSPKSVQKFKYTSYENKLKEHLNFNNPKPVEMITFLAGLFEDKDITILDFFSGSSTTAHAIMQLNSQDRGNRKFIMVQLQESTENNSEASKFLDNLGRPHTICEIGKERIRRAGNKIKEEAGLAAQNLDTGFRVLKLDSSNMKEVYYTPEDYAQMGFNLEGFMDNIKPDRTDEDLLFQVMLDLGIPLSAKISQEGKIFYVNENYLIACFDKVDTDTITEIAKKQPYYVVFRDSSFLNDSALVNVEQVFKTYSPSTIRRVL